MGAEGGLVVCLGFSGEPGDDVGTNGEPGEGLLGGADGDVEFTLEVDRRGDGVAVVTLNREVDELEICGIDRERSWRSGSKRTTPRPRSRRGA